MSRFCYRKAGKYVAVCNKTNFDGHYIKVFEYPQEFIDNYYGLAVPSPAPDAAWFFLNRVDLVACLEGVYPIEIFESLCQDMGLSLHRILKLEAHADLSSVPPVEQGGFRTNVDGHDI